MSALSERLRREPSYRPLCLNCSTMLRMTLEADGRTLWCEPVRDTTFDTAALAPFIPNRFGCGIRIDIETGEPVATPREGE